MVRRLCRAVLRLPCTRRLFYRMIAAVGLFSFGATAQSATAPPAVVTRTDAGLVRGVHEPGFISFRGIPYAAAPVGALRWRPPQHVAHWKGVLDAAALRPDCLQEPFPGDAAPSRVDLREDCLFLNVWRPAAGAGKRAVMVWIHGGGFVNGGSSPLVYDGSEFAKSGVVLVSFNYRLGNFGFFAHPALSAEQPGALLGNYGLMDQIAALEWVKRNIAAFGGDPDNVTVFGESAGGISIHYLMSSPVATGLFNKAIIESGAGRPGRFGSRKISGVDDSAESIGVKLARRFDIDRTDAAALDKLRRVPAPSLAKGLHMGTMSGDSTYVGGPMLDGKLIVGDPAALYAAGRGVRIPIIVGATDRDLGFSTGATAEELLAPFGSDAAAARAIFDPTGTASVGELGARIGGDQFMIEPARYIARILSSRGQPVYEYRFSYVAESIRATTPGATHASELPYVFNDVAPWMQGAASRSDSDAARIIHSYWVAFAMTGTPHVVGAPDWPAYNSESDVILDFTDKGPIVGADPWRERLDLAARVSDKPEH
jgi:para-nitrobenzyl esterase